LNQLRDIWNYPLITLSSGAVISISQVVLAILIVLAGLVLGRWLQKMVGRQMSRTSLNPNSAQTIQRLVFYFILVLVFVTALAMLHIPIGALAFISGAVAIGIGFGAQNIINNLISGWILMTERPVRIGDFIEIDDHKGVVESIGNRSTLIRRVDGVHLLVPNSQMLERVVINWTLRDLRIRTTIRVGVAYGSPVERVIELLYEAVKSQAESLNEPPPLVVFEDFGDNALIFDAYFWADVAGEKELRTIRSDIRVRIDRLFHENGIVIAFPQRDVHFDAGKPLEVRLSRED
jgi:small-conductance mechanosensitive channel